uniref:HVA22-like protein n=1 Tax=Oryza glumipatula TaxID=40148 RepID=A0A0D9YEG9_9ORYZ
MAAAPAFQPFTIRGFAAGMRAVDASKCWPFGRGGGDGEPPPPLPPMEPPKRSRWWAHELAAERARQEARATGTEDAGGGVAGGGGSGKGAKRKGSRGRVRAERARKWRRSLQFGLLSKRKEKTSSRLLHYVLHKQLLSKHKGSTLRTQKELSAQKKFQNTHDCMSTHENNLNKQYIRGMDPSTGMGSNLVRKEAANSSVNKQNIKASEPTIYPLNPGCELVKNVAYPPKDDIFGDLPLLESSKVMFHSGVDELPTVIEDSFVTDQSGPDAISENVSLKLIPPSDMSVQTSSTLKDLVKKEGTPAKKSICISRNDVKKNLPSSAEFDGLNHSGINMVKTCLSDTQLKSTDVPALSSYSNKGLKSGSSNMAHTQQDCFSMNTNYCQEIRKPGTSIATSSVTVRTRTEAIESDRDMAVNSKKSTSISCALVPTECHISSEGSVLSSAISQGSASAATSADGMSSYKSIPSQDSIPTSGLNGTFASNLFRESRKSVDTCTSLSKEDQCSWYSKLHPVCTPASIGSAFMKLPGLERIEISSCNIKTDENMSTNGRPANIVRCEKQQAVIGVPNIMQGQRKTDFSDSQVQEKVLNSYLQQDVYHPCQPTVRLMGKTVSVCERSKEHRVPTMGKGWSDSTIVEDHPSSTSCHFPQKRLFPCQDSVTPSVHVKGSLDILQRIPSVTLPEARATIGNVQNRRLQPINTVSSSVRDCIWNSGSQSVRQAEIKRATTINVNSRARHINLHQPPQVISTSQNQHCQLSTPSILRGKDCSFLGPAVTQSSSFPQWTLNTGIQEKYQKSTFSYDDPTSAPIYQSCQVPGAKLSSTSMISFLDYGTDNAEFSRSLPQACPSLATSLPINFVSTVSPTCTVKPTNTGCRKGVVFTNQRKRPAYINNVAHEPAKKLMANKQDLVAPMFEETKNRSLGWSLDDAIGPRILDFGSKVAGHGLEMSTNESNCVRASSGPVPVLETRSIKPSSLSLAIYTLVQRLIEDIEKIQNKALHRSQQRIMGVLGALARHMDALVGPGIMLLYPLYASMRAIESPSTLDDQQWLTYWVLYSLITLFELSCWKVLQWFPLWPYMKLLFCCWLVLPIFNGAAYIYETHVRRYFKIGQYVSPNYNERQRKVLQMMSLDARKSVERFIESHGPDALDKIIRAAEEEAKRA